MISSEVKVATGTYVNVYGKGFDVFVILNEPNDAPDVFDVEKIETVVTNVATSKKVDKDNFEEVLSERLDALELECLGFGFQILGGRR